TRLPPPLPGEDSIEPAQQIGEIAIARFRRRGFEGAAQRRHDPGMRGRGIDADYAPIHCPNLVCRVDVMVCLHSPEKRRVTGEVSCRPDLRHSACDE
ncbi:MAG: hypothetical protein ACJ8D6_08400, partial [Sphingomicrobium sp.]